MLSNSEPVSPYSRMMAIDTAYVSGKNASPHTWHSSEVFLSLFELKK